MKHLLISFFLGSLIQMSYSQEVSSFTVSAANKDFGLLQFIKYQQTDSTKEHYLLESKSSLWMVYNIHYRLEAYYSHQILDSSKAFYKINGITKHACEITRQDSTLSILHKGEDMRNISLPEHKSYCRSLFNPTQIKDSIFSEYDGSLKSIDHHSDTSFSIFNNKNRAEATYYIADSSINQGEINHFLLKFELTKLLENE